MFRFVPIFNQIKQPVSNHEDTFTHFLHLCLKDKFKEALDDLSPTTSHKTFVDLTNFKITLKNNSEYKSQTKEYWHTLYSINACYRLIIDNLDALMVSY